MRTIVITPPAPFVTLDEAKRHLRVDDDEQDVLIEAYIAAACGHIDGPDGWLGRAIGAQVLEARFDRFGDPMRLPYPPVIEPVSVTYLDTDGVEQFAASDDYELAGAALSPAWRQSWPMVAFRREAVRVRYRAGYPIDETGETPRSTVPAPIRSAVLLMVGDLWRNRGEAGGGDTAQSVAMSITVWALLSPYRVYS